MSRPIPPPPDPSAVWFHGSPLELRVLRAGSTITPHRELARVFSHKPVTVSLDETEHGLAFLHDGRLPGFLYTLEDIRPEDVTPHPNSAMPAGLEWLTRRDLPLRLLSETEIRPEEFLSAEKLEQLRQSQEKGK